MSKPTPLKIEHNVPIPAAVKRRAESWRLLDQMKAGDSVLFTNEDDAEKFVFRLRYANRGKPEGAVMRKDGRGWRVWKTPTKKPGGGIGKDKKR